MRLSCLPRARRERAALRAHRRGEELERAAELLWARSARAYGTGKERRRAVERPDHAAALPSSRQARAWRVLYVRFRVQGSGFRVQGSGCARSAARFAPGAREAVQPHARKLIEREVLDDQITICE